MQSVESEVYRFPLYVSRQAVAWACLGIIGASLVSGLIVRRRLDRLDLVAVLKDSRIDSDMRIWKHARLVAAVLVVAGIVAVALWPEAVEVDVVRVDGARCR